MISAIPATAAIVVVVVAACVVAVVCGINNFNMISIFGSSPTVVAFLCGVVVVVDVRVVVMGAAVCFVLVPALQSM